MEKYYLHLDNEQKGPFTIGQLQAMWKAGTIHRNTQFFTKANAEWKPLEAILDLLETATAPQGQPIQPATALPGTQTAAAAAAPGPAPVHSSAAPPHTHASPARCHECGGLGGHLASCSIAVAISSAGNRPVPQSFHGLVFFSVGLRGFGWLLVIIGAVWALAILTTKHGDNVFGLLFILMPPSGVMAAGILFIVIGEVIGVLFSIEKNTFKTAASLDIIARNLRQNK